MKEQMYVNNSSFRLNYYRKFVDLMKILSIKNFKRKKKQNKKKRTIINNEGARKECYDRNKKIYRKR